MTDGYRYIEDTTPTKETPASASEDTRPPSIREHTTPPHENATADQLQEDLELSHSSDSSASSTSINNDEVRTRRARFKALFFVDDIGEDTTEIRMRTARLYDCTQS